MTAPTEIEFTSPNPANYQIPKGVLYFTPVEGGDRRQVGNVSQAELDIKITALDHYSSMTGIKTKDLTVITEKAAEIKMSFEEFNPENVALALVGHESVNTAGEFTISVLSENMRYGKLEIIGTNDVGPRWNFVFPRVGIKPSAALALIDDKWNKMELTAEVFATAGVFGTATMTTLSTESELRVEGVDL